MSERFRSEFQKTLEAEYESISASSSIDDRFALLDLLSSLVKDTFNYDIDGLQDGEYPVFGRIVAALTGDKPFIREDVSQLLIKLGLPDITKVHNNG